MMDLFKFHANPGLNRLVLLLAVLAVMMLGRSYPKAAEEHGDEAAARSHSSQLADAEGGPHAQTLDGLRQ
ncbi:uncharacterized protein METZ01_LOCUS112867, partial [marine metagenome]